MRRKLTEAESRYIRGYVARHSPKHWAIIVRERFTWALNQINNNVKSIRQMNFIAYENMICPHCYGPRECEWKSGHPDCLYVKAARNAGIRENCAIACIAVAFNGVNCHDQNLISLNRYSIAVETMFMDKYAKQEAIDDIIRDARRFCKGHIEWSNRKDWGKCYQENA